MSKGTPQYDDDTEDDILYEGVWLRIRAIRDESGRMRAKEWLASLELRYQRRFLNAAETVEADLRIGRNTGRWEKVDGSSEGISEFRITKKGARAPHLRMLGMRDGHTLWMASGFKKQTDTIPNREIRKADDCVAYWRQSGG